MNKFKNKIYSIYKDVSILGVQCGVELANKLLKNVIKVNGLQTNTYLNKLFSNIEENSYAKQISERAENSRNQILPTNTNRRSSFARKLPNSKVTI